MKSFDIKPKKETPMCTFYTCTMRQYKITIIDSISLIQFCSTSAFFQYVFMTHYLKKSGFGKDGM